MAPTKAPVAPKPTKKISVPDTVLSRAQQSSMKNFLIVMIAVTVLVAVAGGYFVWVLANKNVYVTNEIKAQDIYVGLAEKKIENLNQAKDKLSSLKQTSGNGVSEFELITQRALPASDDLGSLLTVFQKLEGDTLVKVENITKDNKLLNAAVSTVPNGSSKNSPQSFSITFKATGSYTQMLKFLKDMEASTRVFDFSNLKIGGTSNQLTLDMTYRMYYLPKPSIDDKTMPIEDYKKESN